MNTDETLPDTELWLYLDAIIMDFDNADSTGSLLSGVMDALEKKSPDK